MSNICTSQLWERLIYELALTPNLDFPRRTAVSFITKFFLQLIFPFTFSSFDIS